MELTWIAIIASLCMAAGAGCLFIFAVRKDLFRNLEDARYQVFWSDVEHLVNTSHQAGNRGASTSHESEEK